MNDRSDQKLREFISSLPDGDTEWIEGMEEAIEQLEMELEAFRESRRALGDEE